MPSGTKKIDTLLRTAKQLKDTDVDELRRYAEFRRARHVYTKRGGTQSQKVSDTRHDYEMRQLALQLRARHGVPGSRLPIRQM